MEPTVFRNTTYLHQGTPSNLPRGNEPFITRWLMQPLAAISIRLRFSMILPISPRFVHNRGHGFSKRLNPTGVYCFYHWYRPTPCLQLALFRGKPAGQARLNLYKAWDYPRVIVTTGQVQRLQRPAPSPLLSSPSSSSSSSSFFFITSHTLANGKRKLEDPWIRPH